MVIIILGTNDATTDMWPRYYKDFTPTFNELIKTYTALCSQPLVYIAAPPPIYTEAKNYYRILLDYVINEVYPELIPWIAALNGLPPAIPIFEAFQDNCSTERCDSEVHWLSDDGLHPNLEGNVAIARRIACALDPCYSVSLTDA